MMSSSRVPHPPLFSEEWIKECFAALDARDRELETAGSKAYQACMREKLIRRRKESGLVGRFVDNVLRFAADRKASKRFKPTSRPSPSENGSPVIRRMLDEAFRNASITF